MRSSPSSPAGPRSGRLTPRLLAVATTLACCLALGLPIAGAVMPSDLDVPVAEPASEAAPSVVVDQPAEEPSEEPAEADEPPVAESSTTAEQPADPADPASEQQAAPAEPTDTPGVAVEGAPTDTTQDPATEQAPATEGRPEEPGGGDPSEVEEPGVEEPEDKPAEEEPAEAPPAGERTALEGALAAAHAADVELDRLNQQLAEVRSAQNSVGGVSVDQELALMRTARRLASRMRTAEQQVAPEAEAWERAARSAPSDVYAWRAEAGAPSWLRARAQQRAAERTEIVARDAETTRSGDLETLFVVFRNAVDTFQDDIAHAEQTGPEAEAALARLNQRLDWIEDRATALEETTAAAADVVRAHADAIDGDTEASNRDRVRLAAHGTSATGARTVLDAVALAREAAALAIDPSLEPAARRESDRRLTRTWLELQAATEVLDAQAARAIELDRAHRSALASGASETAAAVIERLEWALNGVDSAIAWAGALFRSSSSEAPVGASLPSEPVADIRIAPAVTSLTDGRRVISTASAPPGAIVVNEVVTADEAWDRATAWDNKLAQRPAFRTPGTVSIDALPPGETVTVTAKPYKVSLGDDQTWFCMRPTGRLYVRVGEERVRPVLQPSVPVRVPASGVTMRWTVPDPGGMPTTVAAEYEQVKVDNCPDGSLTYVQPYLDFPPVPWTEP